MDAFIDQFLQSAIEVTNKLDKTAIHEVVSLLVTVRNRGGRLFILGVGGSAGNASHAVNDFRKLAGIEAYAPTDNVSELTARTNDEGWHTVFAEWLKGSHLNKNDAIFIFSVGGGDAERNISPNLVYAIDYAKEVGAAVTGVVGRDGGYTKKKADACVVVPTILPNLITPLTEAFHAVVWHLLVSHPDLQTKSTKWESTK